MTNGGGSGNLQSSTQPNWNKKETKEPFDYWELSEDKTGFPRRWSPTGFSSQLTSDDHVKRHAKGVGATSKEDYIEKAKSFMQSPRGKHGDAFVGKDGRIGRYDYDTKVMAIAYSGGIIGTYWNLLDDMSEADADAYWEKQK